MKASLIMLLIVGTGIAHLQANAADTIGINKTAKMQKYQWTDELCDNEGYYDTTKVSIKNIEDGFDIFEKLTQVNLPNYAPRNPEQLRELDSQAITKLDADYLKLNNAVERLSVIPKQSGFDMLFFKQKLQQDIANEHQLKRFGLLAYSDISEVLTVTPAVCRRYIVPLSQSEEKLQTAWKRYTLEHIQQQEKLGSTNYRTLAMNRYQSEKAEDANSYAKLDLVGYAWHNCVNKHNQVQGLTSEQVYKAKQAFEKTIFKNTKIAECEMP